MLQLKKTIVRLLLAGHIVIAAGLLLAGYAYVLSPLSWGVLALAGYIFPVMLGLTIVSLAVAVFTVRRHLLVPVVALLAAYVPVTIFFPIHQQQSVPQDALKVISYNTCGWGHTSSGDAAKGTEWDHGETVMRYLVEQDADIVSMQETPLESAWKTKQMMDTILKPTYPYRDSLKYNAHSVLTVFSKHPIVRKQLIPIVSEGNGAAAFWLTVKGREVMVVNCHLESTGLSVEQRNDFRRMVHGDGSQDRDSVKTVSRGIISQLLASSRRRAPQAEAVKTFVDAHADVPTLVTGDFNDISLSYAHHVINRGMTDCYSATAFGPGFSFSRYGMRVRIDNVMCNDMLIPYNFRVDNTISASDHYPVVGWVSLDGGPDR